MLAPAPYLVSLREEKERSREAQCGLHTGGASHTVSREFGTPMSEDEHGGESDISSPHGKKRAAPEDLKAEASKRGKKSLSGGMDSGGDIAAQCPRGDQPLAKP